MGISRVKVIVIGGLNTDIIASGVKKLLRPGELTRSGTLVLGPGGKSRNIAQMTGTFLGAGSVAMIGRTSRDPQGLWRFPLDALKDSGVDTSCVKIMDYKKSAKYPGIALIAVNRKGENQIYCLPGINDDFSPKDIDDAARLFHAVRKNNGLLALALELPLDTAVYAAKKASAMGIRVVLDPGGIDEEEDYTGLLGRGIYAIKPNEHEVKILTGVTVSGIATARKAARAFQKMGINNVMITHGAKGAYAFSGREERHIPVPKIPGVGVDADETGCGDQAMAVLCAETVSGRAFPEAACRAVAAGSLQFRRAGIRPVSARDLEEALTNINRRS